MKKTIYPLLLLVCHQMVLAQGGVGIGTVNPQALLHVDTGAVLFTGPATLPNTPNAPPVKGMGSRMMWYSQKAAFRAGGINSNSHSADWDADSIGRYSAAFGLNNMAKGFAAFATGASSSALGNYSFAAGDGATAQGDYAAAFGYDSKASGVTSFAVGSFNKASGTHAFAGGFSCEATGAETFAFGNELVAKSGAVFGDYNNASDAPVFPYTPTDRLFQIGNGSVHTGRSNALTILRNGNTGIGELTPDAKLHITTNGTGVAPQLLLEESDNDYVRINFKSTATPNAWTLGALPHATGASAQMSFFYAGTGDVFKMYGNGNATLWGTLTQLSDARLKTNITALANPVPLLQKLSGYRYQWRDKTRDSAVQIGLLAQEVQSLFPELVKEDEKGRLSVNYTGLVPVLVEGFKEQQKKIEALEKQVQQLAEKIANK